MRAGNRLIAIAGIALVAARGMSAQGTAGPPADTKNTKGTVTGVLVDSAGAPLAHRTVFYVFRDTTGKVLLIYGVSKSGSVELALSTTTDDAGAFALEVGALKEGQRLELGMTAPLGSRAREQVIGEFTVGTVAVVKGARTARLGTIVAR